MGSFHNQRSPGRYIDSTLYQNLILPTQKIVKDNTFLYFIFSSTLEVRTGKSTLAQQIGEGYYDLLYKIHGIKRELTMDNILFTPKDFMDRARKLPKYSYIILDEWEDSHYWSTLAMTLKTFFQKCGQMNLFMCAIIPNFFLLPIQYATGRSLFAIDVHYGRNFERGFFKFYNIKRKSDLYLKGKKFHNYRVVLPNFRGKFKDGYAVNEQEYRNAKYNDMITSEEGINSLDPQEVKVKLIHKFLKENPLIPKIQVMRMFRIPKSTFYDVYDPETKAKRIENRIFGVRMNKDINSMYDNNPKKKEIILTNPPPN